MHETDTVEETLEKLIPEVEKNCKFIDKNIDTLNKYAAELDDKIDKTKTIFEDCRNQVDKTAAEKIRDILETQEKMKLDLIVKEKEEIEKLLESKKNLQKKCKDNENLKKVVRTSLDRARHATLLIELVQGGLHHRLEEIKKNKEQPTTLKINLPQIVAHNDKWNLMKQEGLLGNIILNCISSLVIAGSVVAPSISKGSRFMDVNLKECLSQVFRKTTQIKLKECYNIKLIKGQIWAALYQGNINIYTADGSLFKTVNIPCPVSLAEAY